MEDVLKILPERIKMLILNLENLNNITEIRLRVGKCIFVYYGLEEFCINELVYAEELINILKNISSNSIYSIQQDINNGFVTIEGGHRIGIVGEVVLQDNKVKNIKNISSINIRIAKEYIGISEKVIKEIMPEDKVVNTIILSPPLCGKTTLLRDAIRNISERGNNVVVIDERGEISPMSASKCIFDVGSRTDIISGIGKDCGMRMAVRSMAPDVVCTDEIGTKEDAEALKYLSISGVNFIVTMHGNSLEDIYVGDVNEIITNGYVSKVIVLTRENGIGTIKEVHSIKKAKI